MKYIDMHCDTITSLYEDSGNLKSNGKHIDINKLKKGECLLQNFAIFTDIDKQDSKFTSAVIDYYYSQLELNRNYIKPIYKYDDIINNENKGLINGMLTLEDGSVIDGNIDKLNWYYDLGVRMITLTWNYPNGIGYPNVDLRSNGKRTDINTKDGLTDFGIEYVRKCNELGIIVDVSHLSDAGFFDVVKYSDKPFVASHSNARSICKVGRNMSDEMIKVLADKGGVMGLNFFAAFLDDKQTKYSSIENMVKHIKHITNVGGYDCIGIGSDFDGIDSELELVDASGMQRLYEALSKEFTYEQLEKIFYKNVLRVYKDNIR